MSMWKYDDVSGGEANRIVYAVHREPAAARDEGNTAKVAVVLKPDGPFSACVYTARHRAAGFKQGQNV